MQNSILRKILVKNKNPKFKNEDLFQIHNEKFTHNKTRVTVNQLNERLSYNRLSN